MNCQEDQAMLWFQQHLTIHNKRMEWWSWAECWWLRRCHWTLHETSVVAVTSSGRIWIATHTTQLQSFWRKLASCKTVARWCYKNSAHCAKFSFQVIFGWHGKWEIVPYFILFPLAFAFWIFVDIKRFLNKSTKISTGTRNVAQTCFSASPRRFKFHGDNLIPNVGFFGLWCLSYSFFFYYFSALPICSMVLEYLPTFTRTTKSPSFVGKYCIHGTYGLLLFDHWGGSYADIRGLCYVVRFLSTLYSPFCCMNERQLDNPW